MPATRAAPIDPARVRELAAAGYTDARIGAELGRPRVAVFNVRKRHGIPAGARPGCRKGTPKPYRDRPAKPPAKPPKPAGEDVDLIACPRCGANHQRVTVRPFVRPPDLGTHYLTCPATGEPVILVVDGPDRPDDNPLKGVH